MHTACVFFVNSSFILKSYPKVDVCSEQPRGQSGLQSCPTSWYSVQHHGPLNLQRTGLLLSELKPLPQLLRWIQLQASKQSYNMDRPCIKARKCKWKLPAMCKKMFYEYLNCFQVGVKLLFLYLPQLSGVLISAPQSIRVLHTSGWLCLADSIKGVRPSFETDKHCKHWTLSYWTYYRFQLLNANIYKPLCTMHSCGLCHENVNCLCGEKT